MVELNNDNNNKTFKDSYCLSACGLFDELGYLFFIQFPFVRWEFLVWTVVVYNGKVNKVTLFEKVAFSSHRAKIKISTIKKVQHESKAFHISIACGKVNSLVRFLRFFFFVCPTDLSWASLFYVCETKKCVELDELQHSKYFLKGFELSRYEVY